jgi:hypothetical protein
MKKLIYKHAWFFFFAVGIFALVLGVIVVAYATVIVANGAFPGKSDSYLISGYSALFFGLGVLLPSIVLRELQFRLNLKK